MIDKLIIWDFEWTLFDPRVTDLTPGALDVLRQGHDNGYANVLFGQNQADNTAISELVDKLGISDLLMDIVVRKDKNIRDFYSIISKYQQISLKKMYLISSRAWVDIKMGNLLGLKTFWIRAGAYANETPRSFEEEPLVILKSLRELRGCLRPDFLI